jgi:hypothetical protein
MRWSEELKQRLSSCMFLGFGGPLDYEHILTPYDVPVPRCSICDSFSMIKTTSRRIMVSRVLSF